MIKALPLMRPAVLFRGRLRLRVQNTAALPTLIRSLRLVQKMVGSLPVSVNVIFQKTKASFLYVPVRSCWVTNAHLLEAPDNIAATIELAISFEVFTVRHVTRAATTLGKPIIVAFKPIVT